MNDEEFGWFSFKVTFKSYGGVFTGHVGADGPRDAMDFVLDLAKKIGWSVDAVSIAQLDRDPHEEVVL